MKTEARYSFESSVTIFQSARRYVSEDLNLWHNRCGNLRSLTSEYLGPGTATAGP